jgi:hypothetical protein
MAHGFIFPKSLSETKEQNSWKNRKTKTSKTRNKIIQIRTRGIREIRTKMVHLVVEMNKTLTFGPLYP